MREIPDIPIFFIIGRPRTGSSLLRTLFDAHPNVNIPIECQFIIDLYPKYGKASSWTEKKTDLFLKDLRNVLFFDKWTIDEKELRKNMIKHAANMDYATACKLVVFHYQSFFDKKKILLLGDKNPGYTIYIGKLLQIFPDAKFIFINRDYRDNFLSLKRVDFELPFISYVTYKWKYFFKAFQHAQHRHTEINYYLKYEDLAANPASEFNKICNFLGIPADNTVFDFYKMKERIGEIYTEEQINKYHSSRFKPISTKNTGVWKSKLSDKSVMIADYVAGNSAEQAGYQKKYHKANLKIKFLAAPGILGGKLLYLLTEIINTLPYKMRSLLLSRGPLFLGSIYLKLFKSQTKSR